MKDTHGREIDYLRISIIDHCNLRCRYCMPVENPIVTPRSELLSVKQLEILARAAATTGFRKIRLTGGEPTLRSDLLEIIERLANVPGIEELVMTTNGLRLPEIALPLKRAGLQRVNIHLDSLNLQNLPLLMRRNVLQKVWRGIEAAEKVGLTPLKINAVVARGFNETDVVGLARLTASHPWDIRYIELMPLGEMAEFANMHYVSSYETISQIEAELGPLAPLNGGQVVGEARLYRLSQAQGNVGFISPVSQPYCDTCSRMRLTGDGRLLPCLLSDLEIDLRPALHRCAEVAELAELFARAVLAKPVGRNLEKGIHPELRTMGQIGG